MPLRYLVEGQEVHSNYFMQPRHPCEQPQFIINYYLSTRADLYQNSQIYIGKILL